MLPKLYSVGEVAEYLGCASSTVYDAVDDGRLRCVRVGAKRTIRITEPALLEFIGEAS